MFVKHLFNPNNTAYQKMYKAQLATFISITNCNLWFMRILFRVLIRLIVLTHLCEGVNICVYHSIGTILACVSFPGLLLIYVNLLQLFESRWESFERFLVCDKTLLLVRLTPPWPWLVSIRPNSLAASSFPVAEVPVLLPVFDCEIRSSNLLGVKL